MKYLSVTLVGIAFFTTILAKSGFENIDSAMLIASCMRVFLEPFYVATSGVYAEPTPFYLVNNNVTYFYYGTGVMLCIFASVIEIVKLVKIGKNSKSACVISLSFCLFYINVSIFA